MLVPDLPGRNGSSCAQAQDPRGRRQDPGGRRHRDLPGHPNRSKAALSPRYGASRKNESPPGIPTGALAKTRSATVTAHPIPLPSSSVRESQERPAAGDRRSGAIPNEEYSESPRSHLPGAVSRQQESRGLAITPLVEDADIWTVARASQLLSSDDEVVSHTAWSQLWDTIASGMSHLLQPNDDIPVDAFLSGEQSEGLYSFRHHSTRANLWTRARHAASRLHCKIAVFSDLYIICFIDINKFI